jgi:LPS export ABC transporter protein LptC
VTLPLPLLLLPIVVLGACARPPEPTASPGPLGLPDREATDVSLAVTDGALPRARLRAPRLFAYDDSLLQVLTRDDTARVHALLFDDAGAPSARLVADTLYYYDRRRRFEARGNVTVDADASSSRLETQKLTWLEESRQIRAPGLSSFRAPGQDLRGYNFEADETLSQYRMTNLSGTVELDDDGNPAGGDR